MTNHELYRRSEHLRGCLLGQAIGDALGTRYEFKNQTQVGKMFRGDCRGNHLPILGGGPFDVVPGQVTDDTELALTLARVLSQSRRFDLDQVARGYQEWFLSRPPDIGRATRTAFGETDRILDATLARQRASANRDSLSNGALMRISPMGLIAGRWTDQQIWDRATQECSLSHPSPIAQEASAIYVMALRDSIEGYQCSRVHGQALARARHPLIERWLMDSLHLATPTYHETLGLINADSQSMGYLGVAFQNAFHQLVSGQTFETGLVKTILLGGDTDTNACITGALLGAYHGQRQIPHDWIQTVLNCQNYRHEIYPPSQTHDLLSLADRFNWE